MRTVFILNLIPIALSVKSLRNNRAAGSGPFGSAPVITPLSLNPISAPDSYTGVMYDPDAKTFDFDAGSSPTTYVVNPPSNIVNSPYDGDFGGLQQVQFVMGQDYAAPLNEFQPTDYTIEPCAPSNMADNDCLSGSDDVGLQLSKPITATKVVRTT